MPKSVLRAVLRRMQFTLHVTRRTPHGASRLVQAMSVWLVKTRRPPSRHGRDARVYGRTTTAMNKLSTPPPPDKIFLHHVLQNTCRSFVLLCFLSFVFFCFLFFLFLTFLFFSVFSFLLSCLFFKVFLDLMCSRTRYASISFVLPLMDYCDCLLYSVPVTTELVPLQDEESARTLGVLML